ncbi:MAG: glycerol-3-phosphate acyltransferase [Chloroflexi bacterium]|nr:glycerol-3-phosphate acyltransferase [Chloroflexota bacterium]
MIILYFLGAGLIGYLCGAIPFGFLYVKLVKKQDLREIGSGRTGGTNSLRAAGVGVGVATGLSDVFKGALGIWLTKLILGGFAPANWLPWMLITAGVMSVVGHNWSVFLKFGGGAGTGPNIGWAMAIWWPMFPIGFVVMVGLLLAVGMASVASLAMAAIVPLIFIVLYLMGYTDAGASPAYLVGGLVAASIIVWALRPNIKRIFNGTERVVGPRARRKHS